MPKEKLFREKKKETIYVRLDIVLFLFNYSEVDCATLKLYSLYLHNLFVVQIIVFAERTLLPMYTFMYT